jgi:integrase
MRLAAIAGNLRVQELTPLHFQSIIATWRQNLTRSTVYHYRRGLMKLVKNIAAMAGRPDLIDQVPRVPSEQARKQIASPAEIQTLLTNSKPWVKCAILLANHAALRASDVLRIAPAHYDAEKKSLTIDQKKTGQTVTVPVTQQLAAMLDNAPEGTGAMQSFVDAFHGKPTTYHALNTAWNVLKKKTGVNQSLIFHDLRRTIAVSLYEVSKDLRVVEQMLGHQSLSSTIRYLEHRDPTKLKPYLDAIFIPKGPIQ